MSWNDQNNNNGSRDPWGNKNDAPDIDEAIKRFKAIFGPIFGGSSGGGGGKNISFLPNGGNPSSEGQFLPRKIKPIPLNTDASKQGATAILQS